MSFNPYHTISINNYEEWFILYMDNELPAEQKKMVEDFVLLHPHLQEELELLLSTRLPAEEMVFAGKEELLAPVMKLNIVDEALLLYVDNELSAMEQKEVESRLVSDKNLRLQYELLLKTKLKNEKILYPNKKELYRYAERRVTVPVWMRVAAAVVLLLSGGYFFIQEQGTDTIAPGNVAVIENPAKAKELSIPGSTVQEKIDLPQQDQGLVVTEPAEKKVERNERKAVPAAPVQERMQGQLASLEQPKKTVETTPAAAIQDWDAVRVEVKKTATQLTTSLNNSMANLRVTSVVAATYNQTEDPQEPAVTNGDNKRNHRTPAKGFLRKVSRFIERRTGIGTVNADNELLVGAVSLKLN